MAAWENRIAVSFSHYVATIPNFSCQGFHFYAQFIGNPLNRFSRWFS